VTDTQPAPPALSDEAVAELAAFADAWARVLPITRAAVAADIASHAQRCADRIRERAIDAERGGLLNTARESHDFVDVLNIWQALAMALATEADAEAGPQPVFVEVPR